RPRRFPKVRAVLRDRPPANHHRISEVRGRVVRSGREPDRRIRVHDRQTHESKANGLARVHDDGVWIQRSIDLERIATGGPLTCTLEKKYRLVVRWRTG